MTLDLRDPRCDKCGEDRLLERVVTESHELGAQYALATGQPVGGTVTIFCPVCAHSWTVAS